MRNDFFQVPGETTRLKNTFTGFAPAKAERLLIRTGWLLEESRAQVALAGITEDGDDVLVRVLLATGQLKRRAQIGTG